MTENESEPRPVPATAIHGVMPMHGQTFNLAEAAQVIMARDPEMGRTMWRALLSGEAGDRLRIEAEEHLWYLFWEMIENVVVPNGRIIEELIEEVWPDYKRIAQVEYVEGKVLDDVILT
ncbi:MAG: hypothetical protein JWN33_303 [Candidatus Saccharibacteria bacterium]|nr:hypothetical protein [Candidatus Saccharibacteria bacterium]